MDNKVVVIVGGILAGLLILVLGAIGFALVSDNDPIPAPQPVITSEPSPTVDPDQFILDILEQTWNEQSYADQKSLCMLFTYSPEQAWNAFDGGSEHLVSKEVFMSFFSGKCSNIT